jgi:hypothetical protein
VSQWPDLPQPQQQHQPQQRSSSWQSSSFYSASNISHAASAFVGSCSTAADPDPRSKSAPLLVVDKAGSAGSASSSAQQNKERVRALVAHGGAFRHTGLGGMWSYVGGAQKLVGVPKHASIAELQGQLTGQPLSSTSAQVRVCLPGYLCSGGVRHLPEVVSAGMQVVRRHSSTCNNVDRVTSHASICLYCDEVCVLSLLLMLC